MTVLRTLLICCMLSACHASAADPPHLLPATGPENGGLCVRLQIKPPRVHQSEHVVRLEVLNSGKKPITLVGGFFYENDKSYLDYLKEDVFFTSFPEVMPSSFGTTGVERESPQPRTTLAPDESLVAQWTTEGAKIGGGFESNQLLEIERNGLYLVRAHLLLHTAEGNSVKLWSNEQEFIVGGSRQAPRASVATVTQVDDRAGSIQLDAGSNDGIQMGDVFEVGQAKGGTLWHYKVATVTSRGATARLISQPTGGSPHVGERARFVRAMGE